MGIYLDVCFRCSWKKEGNGRIKCMIFFFKGRGLGFCCFWQWGGFKLFNKYVFKDFMSC